MRSPRTRGSSSDSGGRRARPLGLASRTWPAWSTKAHGGSAVTPSTVTSLGGAWYGLLPGSPRFAGDAPLAVARAHVRGRPVPVGGLAGEAPPALAAACERALAKDPGERPTASAFVAMLHSGGEPATAVLERAGVTTTAVGPAGPRASRRGVWLGSVILGCLPRHAPLV